MIPAISIDDLLRKLHTTGFCPINMMCPLTISGNISLYELFCINMLVATLNPKILMEFGTFNGRTTLNMAANCKPIPDSSVTPDSPIIYTVDLPRDKIGKTQHPLADGKHEKDDELGYIGFEHKLFHNTIFEKFIRQIWSDTADLKHTQWENCIDFLFVDASHSYENCFNDSNLAFDFVRDNGWIIWHDYNGWPGVTKALNILYEHFKLNRKPIVNSFFQISGTSLAICQNIR